MKKHLRHGQLRNVIKATAAVMDAPAVDPIMQGILEANGFVQAGAPAGNQNAARPHTYHKGDRAEYTGETRDISGGKFHVLEIMEGASKGKEAVTQRGPDGSDPYTQQHQKDWHKQQEEFRRLHPTQATDTTMSTTTLSAHEATGHTTMREHEQAMKSAVTKAIQGDNRFMPTEAPAEAANVLKVAPCCIDVTTPDADGTHHAIIHTHNGLVKHPFDYDHEEGKATMHDGAPNATESKKIYATEVERHENMIRAMAETISCRAGDGSGVKLAAKDWVAGKSVSYIYVPGGITTINAGFRRNESITCTVEVDELTAKDLQDSFDFIAATEKQEPYADEDHESKKATLRFPAQKVQFTYGTHRGEEGVIVSGAEPTTYGAEAVNGKVYASWSPEFATDADYSKAKCKKGHWTFPDGVRGSASNPARLVAVNFVTGALTNKPAFKNMPNVKAKHTPAPESKPTDIITAAWSDAARAAAVEARKHGSYAEYADDAHEASKRALDLSRTTEGHHQERGAHREASTAHSLASTEHRYAAKEAGNEELAKHHEAHAAFHDSMLFAHARLHDHMKEAGKQMTTASEVAEAKNLIQAAANATTDAGKSGYELMCKNAEEKSRDAQAQTAAAKDQAGHKMAADLHHDASALHRLAADAAQQAGNATLAKEHSEKANAHAQKSTDHFKEAQAQAKERTAAATDRDPVMARIIARYNDAQSEVVTIACKTPDVAAALEAAHKPVEKVDATIETIIARNRDDKAWLTELLGRNPLVANHEALAAIANRNK